MLIASETDIRGPVIVLDLEWVGNTTTPSSTHVVQLACRNIVTKDCFACNVTALAAGNVVGAVSPCTGYTDWIAWLLVQRGDAEGVCLVAHNGIRYDAPVLLNNMRRYDVPVPDWITIMDSLYHLRHHTKHWKERKPHKYDIDSMCAYCGIDVLAECRHSAGYDVDLLCEILMRMHATHQIPIISGAAQPLNSLSTMLVRGIGPVVWSALPKPGLLAMCQDIISRHGNLGEASCTEYLQEAGLQARVPLCNLRTIAKNVASSARVHLQYLENTYAL